MGEVDKETHISLDDQQKINKFARLNSRLEDLKEELSGKTSEITTLEDASLDITMLDEEEDGLVPFQVGEVFLSLKPDEAEAQLEEMKQALQKDSADIDVKMDEIRGVMSTLKTHLYAKFGNAINLDADDE
eukprot:TRINITY_DN600_c0_g1_i1.p1 TRINITY_DN600_c0_g1~~TRINITY_DN600_c0_g1_i1.p1  ORF type:complete len:131 (+),score=66.05 TRINITY_DN600_c0_g1_i1:83-475(+)